MIFQGFCGEFSVFSDQVFSKTLDGDHVAKLVCRGANSGGLGMMDPADHRFHGQGFRNHWRRTAAAFGGRFWERVHGCFMVIKVILRGFKQVSGSISKISDFRFQV